MIFSQVEIGNNTSLGEMQHMIRSFTEDPRHEVIDMTVVVILSDGDEGKILARDGQILSTEWVLNQFTNHSCPQLRGKPKFFIFSSCR